MNSRPNPSVLVIGGGVAGTATAITLGRHGVAVDLVEKSVFPRDKTCGCCLGTAGSHALEQLGVRPETIADACPTSVWHGSLDGRQFCLPLPDGWAISRKTLDPALLEIASGAGANVRMPLSAKVISLDQHGVTVDLQSADSETSADRRTYDVVVIAAGISFGGIESFLPYIERPEGPLGVSYMTTDNQVTPGTIYMACDDDGYVGVVRFADGRVDVAGALARGADAARRGSPEQRMKRILSDSGLGFSSLDPIGPVMTTPALRRRRQPGNGRLIAVGDAAGYVEPFTGEGMTWALQSGQAAGQLIASLENLDQLGDRWVRHQRSLLGKRKRTCRWVTTALRSRRARTAAVWVLRSWPGLSAPLLNRLSRTG